MYPGTHARLTPDKPAQIMQSSGEVLTYRELDEHSNRLAHVLFEAGLRRGDTVAVMLENHPRFLEVVWAALRSGLYLTPINRYLTAGEAAYIVNDCGARAFVTSAKYQEVAGALVPLIPGCPTKLLMETASPGFDDYESAVAGAPATPIAEEHLGMLRLYSSGTTGRPKGVHYRLPDLRPDVEAPSIRTTMDLFDIDADSTYLSPAPLYHGAPLVYCTGVQRRGGTVVISERFDAADTLAAIERYRVTHSQWVPTMFVRMLKLPEQTRHAHDLSSHRVAVHAAAPCPVEVKRRMIDWWGPILREYYSATELDGITYIDSETWLRHPGSVGRFMIGTPHVCDDTGREVPVGEIGTIYLERSRPGKPGAAALATGAQAHPDHPNWLSCGDVGRIDDEGFVYLTDRQAFMIISGGVNIYPQEIEDLLTLHPAVEDVAVIGVPDDDLGEAVKAVVQLADPGDQAGIEDTLIGYCRERMAAYKCPRSVDLVDELPRLPTGKLYKTKLRDHYRDLAHTGAATQQEERP